MKNTITLEINQNGDLLILEERTIKELMFRKNSSALCSSINADVLKTVKERMIINLSKDGLILKEINKQVISKQSIINYFKGEKEMENYEKELTINENGDLVINKTRTIAKLEQGQYGRSIGAYVDLEIIKNIKGRIIIGTEGKELVIKEFLQDIIPKTKVFNAFEITNQETISLPNKKYVKDCKTGQLRDKTAYPMGDKINGMIEIKSGGIYPALNMNMNVLGKGILENNNPVGEKSNKYNTKCDHTHNGESLLGYVDGNTVKCCKCLRQFKIINVAKTTIMPNIFFFKQPTLDVLNTLITYKEDKGVTKEDREFLMELVVGIEEGRITPDTIDIDRVFRIYIAVTISSLKCPNIKILDL